jgi:hypothetical protein
MAMTHRRQWVILGVLTGVYLIGLGVLGGIVSERFRFDDVRTNVLRRLEEATHRAPAHAMASEKEVQRVPPPSATPATEPGRRPPVWAAYLEMVDAALAQHDVSTAVRAWREAHAAALRTRAWRPLVEVGDAVIRIGRLDSGRGAYVTHARETYMAALIRARADRSVDGVLRVAESFAALGDRRVVEQCLVIADRLGASTDNEVIARLRHRALGVRATPHIEP